MPEYRRVFVPGGTYFFTVVTEGRARFLCEDRARACLREAFRIGRARWPFAIDAVVLLPDHLHALWSLPAGDAAYPRRWAAIKRQFSSRWLATGGDEAAVSAGRHRQRRRGVFLPRYWEHAIRDEHDFERHIDYIHFNPVKHGLCRCPRDWAVSSFHRYAQSGDYEPEWGCQAHRAAFDFADIEATAHE